MPEPFSKRINDLAETDPLAAAKETAEVDLERVRIDDPARGRIEDDWLGQTPVGDEMPVLAGDDAERETRAAAQLGQHDGDQHQVSVAAFERAVDQQLVRPAVVAGAQRRVRDDLPERAQLRPPRSRSSSSSRPSRREHGRVREGRCRKPPQREGTWSP